MYMRAIMMSYAFKMMSFFFGKLQFTKLSQRVTSIAGKLVTEVHVIT